MDTLPEGHQHAVLGQGLPAVQVDQERIQDRDCLQYPEVNREKLI